MKTKTLILASAFFMMACQSTTLDDSESVAAIDDVMAAPALNSRLEEVSISDADTKDGLKENRRDDNYPEPAKAGEKKLSKTGVFPLK